MREDLERRAEEIAVYLVEHVCTIREAAGKFGVSKSTVHVEVTVQNVSGGLSHKPKITRAGSKSLPARFFALCCFLYNHIFH